jgi:hypothetical protein
MYGFPEDLNLNPIIGRDLNLMGLGRSDVQLNFSGSGIKICVQGPIEIIEIGEVIASWNEKGIWDSLNFQRVLNETVESFSIPRKDILEIKFSNGLILRLIDDSQQYEVAQIYFDDDSYSSVIV